MPRWLPATEPETIKLVWLAAVNVQVSLVVSKPFAVTTTVPSPLLEPAVTGQPRQPCRCSRYHWSPVP